MGNNVAVMEQVYQEPEQEQVQEEKVEKEETTVEEKEGSYDGEDGAGEAERKAEEFVSDADRGASEMSAADFERRKVYLQRRHQPQFMESLDAGDALQLPSAVVRTWGCSEPKQPWEPYSTLNGPADHSGSFSYHPLQQDKEIRLIHLLPPSETSPDLIQCAVVHTLLDYDWPWAALSYTWSTLEENEQKVKVHERILLDGCWFEVTKNLYAALRTLRKHNSAASHKLLLWIDAICINQSDIAERTNRSS